MNWLREVYEHPVLCALATIAAFVAWAIVAMEVAL